MKSETILSNRLSDVLVLVNNNESKASVFLEKSVPMQIEKPVFVDDDRIGQLLLALINNAQSHAPASSKISVGLTQTNADTTICVKDSGSDFSDEALSSAQEKF